MRVLGLMGPFLWFREEVCHISSGTGLSLTFFVLLECVLGEGCVLHIILHFTYILLLWVLLFPFHRQK